MYGTYVARRSGAAWQKRAGGSLPCQFAPVISLASPPSVSDWRRQAAEVPGSNRHDQDGASSAAGTMAQCRLAALVAGETGVDKGLGQLFYAIKQTTPQRARWFGRLSPELFVAVAPVPGKLVWRLTLHNRLRALPSWTCGRYLPAAACPRRSDGAFASGLVQRQGSAR